MKSATAKVKDGDLLLGLLLTMRGAPPGSHHASLYVMWREAMCQQMKWTPENFEERMDKAEAR